MGSNAAVDDALVVVGICLLLLSLACLGTWPALLRLCTWNNSSDEDHNESVSISCCGRKLVKAQDRHPCHVYIDYSLAYLIASIIPILLEVCIGDDSTQQGTNFFASPALILVSMVGGSLLSVGNLCMQWSTAIFGAPLTTVLAMEASLTVVLGTSINYLLEPEKTAHPSRLACGVFMFLIAIGIASLAQTWYANAHISILDSLSITTNVTVPSRYLHCRSNYEECGDIEIEAIHTITLPHVVSESSFQNYVEQDIRSTGSDDSLNIAASSENRAKLGLCVALFGGICFGFFSPAFNIAVNDPFDWHEGAGLSVPVANFWFAFSFVACGILGNLHLLKLDTGDDGRLPQPRSWSGYLGEEFRKRKLALSAGMLCALGNVLQFQGGHLAGYAASDLVQAFPLVATIWDVTIFGEFKKATRQVLGALFAMYICYMSGIGFLAMSIAL